MQEAVYGLPKAVKLGFYQMVIGSPGLAAYWRCEETSGTTLTDQFGDVLTLAGSGTTLGVDGAVRFTRGVTFNGSGYAQASGSGALPLGSAARTVGLFFRHTSTGVITLFSYGVIGTRQMFNVLANGSSAGDIGLNVYNASLYGFSGKNDGKWHLFIGTYESGASDAKVYCDTASAVSGTLGGALNTTNGTRCIGRDSPQGTFNYPGSVDEVCVWNRVLTSVEIARLMATSRNNG